MIANPITLKTYHNMFNLFLRGIFWGVLGDVLGGIWECFGGMCVLYFEWFSGETHTGTSRRTNVLVILFVIFYFVMRLTGLFGYFKHLAV